MTDLRDQLEDFLKTEMKSDKKKLTLEQVFEKTLEITTISTPGDLRSTRKWDETPKTEYDEWY